MAIIAGTGPPPSTKISTSAMTISGIARITSMIRRKTGIRRGQRAMPRVDSIDRIAPPMAPIRVDTAAMLIVSIKAGKKVTRWPGSSPIFSEASAMTVRGKSSTLVQPSQNPPALRASATMKPDTIRDTNMASRMPE